MTVLSCRPEERVDSLGTFPAIDLIQQYRSALVLPDVLFGHAQDTLARGSDQPVR